jgi:hypothetical protein
VFAGEFASEIVKTAESEPRGTTTGAAMRPSIPIVIALPATISWTSDGVGTDDPSPAME